MANKTILMSLLRHILRLYGHGPGKKRIGALTGISRNTIKKDLHTFVSLQLTYTDIDLLEEHQLDKLFAPAAPATPVLKDERLQQMQRLLPELEKQLRRKGVTRLQL